MWALITGASSGIGFALAENLAKEGKNIVALGRNEENLLKVKKILEEKYGIEVLVVVRDLALPESGKYVHDLTREKGIEVFTLINNAGFGDFGEFSKSNLKKQRDMIAVNITALTDLTYYYLNDMLDKGGVGEILNVSSMAAFMPGPLLSVYYASKAYVKSFTEAISREIKTTDINIMALCPGPTLTNFEKNAEAESSGLFKNLINAEAKDVANYALLKLRSGKKVSIHGLLNKALCFGVRFLPDPLVRNMVYETMRARRIKP